MAINTKTNSTALSYLSIITIKTVETIAIFKFVEVATQSHRQEETGGFRRFYEGIAVVYVNREGCEWQVEWVVLLDHILSDHTEVLVLYTKFSGTTILMSTNACAFANLWLANLNRNCIMYTSTIGAKCMWHRHLPSTVTTLRCRVL